MLQAQIAGGKVVTLVPSMFRTRTASAEPGAELGRVLLFTGVRYERRAEDERPAAGAHGTADGRGDSVRS